MIEKNTTYYNSNLLLKVLSWITLAAFGFVIFHLVMMLIGFDPKPWIREVYIDLQNGIPFFLFLTGSFIRNRKLRIPMILFFSVFFIGYVLRTLDFYGLVDIDGNKLSWLIGPPLLGLLITYIIHFFSKPKKKILDYLKVIWFFCISYTLISVVFPIISYRALYFFYVTIIIFPFMMGIGFFNYFRKTNP
jgi:hypothetical protein